MIYQVWDTSANRLLDGYPDEPSARAGLLVRIRRPNVGLSALHALKVERRHPDGTTEPVSEGRGLAVWIALGSSPRPQETVTTVEPATDDHLAFLHRREVSITVETMMATVPSVVILALVAGLLFGWLAGALVGLLVAVLLSLFVLGCGLAIAWGRCTSLRLYARRRTVTVKRGPFVTFVEVPPVRVHQTKATKAFALFADGAIELTEEHAEPLVRLGPVPAATVVLFPQIAQIVEVRGPDDVTLYRHPDYWPTTFQVGSDGAVVPRNGEPPRS